MGVTDRAGPSRHHGPPFCRYRVGIASGGTVRANAGALRGGARGPGGDPHARDDEAGDGVPNERLK